MREFVGQFSNHIKEALDRLPTNEIARALNILQAVYERDGRIYVFGNGGSLAIATHWVSDFNKTVFSQNIEKHQRRFQAIRLPSTESEITAWANDVGYDMIFAGPLQNYLQDADAIIAISSSGNSPNILKAVELAKSRKVPVIGLSGFNGGKLNELADAKVLVTTAKGEYEVVESVHHTVMHLMTKYFKSYFEHLVERSAKGSPS